MSKSYPIRLQDKVMSLLRPDDTLSTRVNQILARYAWVQRSERDRVHGTLSPAAWQVLRAEWPRGFFRLMHPSKFKALALDVLQQTFPEDAGAVERMSQAQLMVLLELVEAEAVDWAGYSDE